MSRDTSFYYSFLVLPPAKRHAIIAVWDFCRAVDDAVDDVGRASRARPPPTRSRGGGGELAACFEGRDTCRHGRAARWRRSSRPSGCRREPFEALIEGVEMDSGRGATRPSTSCIRYLHPRRVGRRPRCASTSSASRDAGVAAVRDRSRRRAAAHEHPARRARRSRAAAASTFRRRICAPPAAREDDLRDEVGQRWPRRPVAGGQGAAATPGERAPGTTTRARPACCRARMRAGWWRPRSWRAIYRGVLDGIERRDYDVFSEVVRVPRPRRAVIAAVDLELRHRSLVPGHARRQRASDASITMTPDVIVVGGGFAGLSAATALGRRRTRVLVLEARPQLGGRATAFRDRVTGELVDNGQHVLFGCYTADVRVSEPDRCRGQRPAAAGAERAVSSIAPGTRSVLECPALPPPLHLLGARAEVDAMSWARSAVGPADGARRCRPRGASSRAPARGRWTATCTVSQWLRDRGQTEKLTDWLWEPLALAALNQSPDEALATPFVRVLAEMFGPDRDGLGDRAADPAAARDVRRAGARLHRAPRRGSAHWRARARR